MAIETLDGRALKEALAFAADRFAREEHRLNDLDGAIGDGDHGITMRIGFDAIRAAVAPLDDSTAPGAILRKAGMAFMGATGGAIGVIFGKALRARGRRSEERREIGPAEFAAVLQSMETRWPPPARPSPATRRFSIPSTRRRESHLSRAWPTPCRPLA